MSEAAFWTLLVATIIGAVVVNLLTLYRYERRGPREHDPVEHEVDEP